MGTCKTARKFLNHKRIDKTTMTDNHRNKTNDENKKASWLQFIERRLLGTFKNSLAGLSIAFKSEEAFRVEALLMAIALPAIYWVAESVMESLLLLIVTALILITELINSAVEATVDRVGMDYHELSKKAKDIGSAAVLISLLLAAVTWGVLIFT